jgi:ABC-2 type transport system permease protein
VSASTATSEVAATDTGLGSPAWGGFDPSRTQGRGLGDAARSFRTAALLGWQMEANWTDPVLFFIYSVAKPLSATLLLVFMIQVIGGAASHEFLAFVVVGSALWAFVLNGITGLPWAILEDRERYRMLKYVYVSPSRFIVVLLGRGVARVAVGGMGALITLAVGVLALGVPFEPGAINWPLLVVVNALGLATVTAIAVAMAAVCIQVRQEAWFYPETTAGALFLLSGAVFPLTVLPGPVQLIALLDPLTWWIAGVREALFPAGIDSVGGVGSTWHGLTGTLEPGPGEIVLALLVTGALVTLASFALFRISERRAKNAGLLDQTTGS